VHEARFGLVGLARLQIARLNVIHLPPPGPIVPPTDPCHVAIGFLRPGGEPFVDDAGAAIVLEQDLRTGDVAVLELRSADAFRDSRALRTLIRPTAFFSHVPVPADAPEPCGAIVPSLEIYEPATGRTQIFTYPLEIFDFNPQPEPAGTLPGSNH
jgi:hypothetical protein